MASLQKKFEAGSNKIESFKEISSNPNLHQENLFQEFDKLIEEIDKQQDE